MNSKKTKICILIVIIVAIIITLLMLFGKKEVVRDAKWDENMESVIRREQKNNPDSKIVVNDSSIQVNYVSMYDEPCYVAYDFGEDNKLCEITFGFHTSDGTTFEDLDEILNSEYGKEDSYEDFGTISQTKKWVKKDYTITLEYIPQDTSTINWSDLKIEYKKQ